MPLVKLHRPGQLTRPELAPGEPKLAVAPAAVRRRQQTLVLEAPGGAVAAGPEIRVGEEPVEWVRNQNRGG